MSYTTDAPAVLSVTELTHNIKAHLEQAFTRVWVSGEISNFVHHSSGHMYFSLKDAGAQLSAVMFRGQNRGLLFGPMNGMQILAHGDISVYPPRGQYQMVVDQLQPAGAGGLHLAFEALKQKLAGEGLFDSHHKKPLPKFPECIGVVTSVTGAAIRDMIQIISRRFPLSRILLYNAKVQGDGAAGEIVAGIAYFNSHQQFQAQSTQTHSEIQPCDVLIIGRGGGSIEDLWPFNEEVVARAIYHSVIPVISAVGHEIDVTISDLVADMRAPTPSAAAELVVPDQATLIQTLDKISTQLPSMLTKRLNDTRSKLLGLTKSYALKRPQLLVQAKYQYVDQLNDTLQRLLSQKTQNSHLLLDHLTEKLMLLDPLKILGRGYSIIQNDLGQIIKTTEQVVLNQSVHVTVQHGTFDAKVEKIHDIQTKK
ncbi:MAG: exodeoxyribonuclease VII large subunit [Candidatus Marinimicrobia bacterium CG_4_9_14_3_um_filter_48_9]|nr:MAG: exodeoxyribonuclease VII large subunit [Candidatus Marinimicrobia bacterium CG_4_9_14_3_um_filter_48_9]